MFSSAKAASACLFVWLSSSTFFFRIALCSLRHQKAAAFESAEKMPLRTCALKIHRKTQVVVPTQKHSAVTSWRELPRGVGLKSFTFWMEASKHNGPLRSEESPRLDRNSCARESNNGACWRGLSWQGELAQTVDIEPTPVSNLHTAYFSPGRPRKTPDASPTWRDCVDRLQISRGWYKGRSHCMSECRQHRWQ